MGCELHLHGSGRVECVLHRSGRALCVLHGCPYGNLHGRGGHLPTGSGLGNQPDRFGLLLAAYPKHPHSDLQELGAMGEVAEQMIS